MRLGIMQPYFFPYVGYFSLIHYCDAFVLFDTSQYIQRGWVNRNRIINPERDYTYLTVPIQKAAIETPINQVKIDNSQEWKTRLISQLVIYKKRAKYYEQVYELVANILKKDFVLLSDLNIESTKSVCSFLRLDVKFHVYSSLNLGIQSVGAPDEWALEITRKMGFDTYVNPPGGMSFFHREKYESAGIQLEFLQSNLSPYVQRIGRFIGGLSIIDVLMFNSVDETRRMLEDFVIL